MIFFLCQNIDNLLQSSKYSLLTLQELFRLYDILPSSEYRQPLAKLQVFASHTSSTTTVSGCTQRALAVCKPIAAALGQTGWNLNRMKSKAVCFSFFE